MQCLHAAMATLEKRLKAHTTWIKEAEYAEAAAWDTFENSWNNAAEARQERRYHYRELRLGY
jgi:hypothetical protein